MSPSLDTNLINVIQIGDGNFHETILYDASDLGMSNKDDLVKELGEQTVDVMRKIKKALDPHGLMNPGKIFDI
ncbi:hypothetical protein AC578_3022 [Pseudocercospora eumusae]|uniref:FAD-binding oxidoreductase/transferase type 4 C-terminal domain-containing protein n=1 Tax=Pseudocercospora eumusae TaxID=321146 RepID=A0A139H1T8_9PEZI|nr:hypothetical protein AC578_3022 [Pseudocercospora eumusae]